MAYVLASAGRANIRYFCPSPAVVADNFPPRFVIGHGNSALLAAHHITATPTGQECRITSAIEKQYNLSPFIEACPDLFIELDAEDALVALF